MVEDESVRLCGMKSISLDFVNQDHTHWPFYLQNNFCDIDLVQTSTLEDMMSYLGSIKPSEVPKFRIILSDRLSYVVENMPICTSNTPSQDYNFKRWKTEQALYDASNCNTHCTDNNDKYYDIQHGLKKDLDPHVDISSTFCGPRMMQNLNQPKHGLIWAFSYLMVEQLQKDIW